MTALVFLFYLYWYEEPARHLRYDMQYKRYFFQYAQPGAYDRLGPARPCRCGVTASDSFIWVDRRHETRCIMGYYSIVVWVDRVGHVVQSS